MRRAAVIRRLRREAHARGLMFREHELTRHTAVTIGTVTRTLGRHREIDEVTADKFFDQFAEVLGGKGWWR